MIARNFFAIYERRAAHRILDAMRLKQFSRFRYSLARVELQGRNALFILFFAQSLIEKMVLLSYKIHAPKAILAIFAVLTKQTIRATCTRL